MNSDLSLGGGDSDDGDDDSSGGRKSNSFDTCWDEIVNSTQSLVLRGRKMAKTMDLIFTNTWSHKEVSIYDFYPTFSLVLMFKSMQQSTRSDRTTTTTPLTFKMTPQTITPTRLMRMSASSVTSLDEPRGKTMAGTTAMTILVTTVVATTPVTLTQGERKP